MPLTAAEKREILELAKSRFKDCSDNWNHIREEYIEDIKFKAGEQWDEGSIAERMRDGRPTGTINRIDGFTNRVINDGLQNRPAIKVRPVDDKSDYITAEVQSGLIRHIINNGDSKTAFDTAYTNAVSGGIGYFRALTEYVGSESFEQEIRVERIENPCTVYVPYNLIKNPDFSDMPYAFIRQKISKDEFKKRWPKLKNKLPQMDEIGVGDNSWMTEDEIYIAEYFVKEEEKGTLYEIQNLDGTTSLSEILPEGIEPIRQREITKCKIKWYLITCWDVLEDPQIFPGKQIPIIPVVGQEIIIDGKKHFVSLTRYLMEPQQFLNYWWSTFTEQIALAPKAPWVVVDKQIEGYEKIWQDANKKPQAFLPYKAVDSKGNLIPPPIRNNPPEVGTAILEGIRFANEFMKEVSGIYDASLGASSNERSGKAIMVRSKQGDIATYHFVNNYNRAIRSLGKLLINIIPDVYGTPRAVRILGEDMVDKVVYVNQVHKDVNDETRLYDLTTGNYDVIVDIGPSYDTKRLETADMLFSLMQTAPETSMVAADILARVLDFPGNMELSERFKRFINLKFPGVVADDEMGTPEQQLKNQIQQITLDIQKLVVKSQQDEMIKNQLMQTVQAMDMALKSKDAETAAKIEVARIRADTQIKSDLLDIRKENIKQEHAASMKQVDTALKILPGLGKTEKTEKSQPPAGQGRD